MTRARPTLQHDAQLVAIDSLKPYPGNARTHDLDVIVDRWERHTGQSAKLAAKG